MTAKIKTIVHLTLNEEGLAEQTLILSQETALDLRDQLNAAFPGLKLPTYQPTWVPNTYPNQTWPNIIVQPRTPEIVKPLWSNVCGSDAEIVGTRTVTDDFVETVDEKTRIRGRL